MPRIMSASELQRNISKVYEVCESTKEPVYITRNGQSNLVVMDADAFNDQLDLQRRVFEREMRAYAGIMRGAADFAAGRSVDFADIRRDA